MSLERNRAPRSTPPAVLVTVLAALCAATPAAALDITWTGGSGSWSNAANWSPNNVPDAAGEVAILPAGSYQVTLDQSPSPDDVQVGAGVTLDLATYSIAGAGHVANAGTVKNFRGVFDGRFANLSGGTLSVAPDDSMIAGGELSNDGTIVVGPTFATAIHMSQTLRFNGSGKLELAGGRISTGLPIPQFSRFFINGTGHTLAGSGFVHAPLYNNHRIEVDGEGHEIQAYMLHNYGTTQVVDGGTVTILHGLAENYGQIRGTNGRFQVRYTSGSYGTIDNQPNGSGRLIADGGDLFVNSGVILNGSVERSGGAGAVRVGQAAPQDLIVTAGSEMWVEGFVDLMENGGTLTNHGLIKVIGWLNFGSESGSTIDGGGVIELAGGIIGYSHRGPVTLAAGSTIRGCGTIEANLINHGTVEVDCPTMPLAFRYGTTRNHGTLRAKRGTLHFTESATKVINAGRTITIDPGAQMLIDRGATFDNTGGTLTSAGLVLLGWHTSANIVGGTIEGTGSALFRNRKLTTLRDVTLGAGVVLQTENHATTRVAGASFTHRGINRVQAGGAFTADPGTSYSQPAGTIELQGGAITVPRGIQLGGALRGAGTITGDVVNAGEVAPALDGGGIQLNGDYVQSPAGRLAIELSGPSTFGRLNVTGAATLDGLLDVAPLGGFDPGPGSSFPVMTFGSHTGTFGVETAPGLDLVPLYDAANLSLVHSGTVSVDPGDVPRALRFYARGNGLALELPKAATLAVRLYDVAGREVANLADGARPAGVHALAARGVASGMYFARAIVTTAEGREVRGARLLILR